MDRFLERRALRLRLLSPCHLGTGEELNWMTAVIDPQRAELWRIDPSRLSPATKVGARLEKYGREALNLQDGSEDFIRAVQQTLKQYRSELRHTVHARSGITPRLAERLDALTGANRCRGTGDRGAVQTLAILEAALAARSGAPAFPGSAVKGALRTAWLDHLQSQRPAPSLENRSPKAYPEWLLGGAFSTDPFRGIRVEDFTANGVASCVMFAVNRKRSDPTKTKSDLSQSVVAALPGGLITGAVRYAEPRGAYAGVAVDPLLAACHRFHLAHWSAQRSQLSGHVPGWWLKAMDEIAERSGPDKRAVLLRIGKYASAESKTTRHRRISVRTKKNAHEHRDQGTTFWLAQDYGDRAGIPFGWALLEWSEESCAASIQKAFAQEHPWSIALSHVDARLAPDVTEHAGSDTTGAEPGPASVEIARMAELLAAGQLAESYIKTTIQTAIGWSDPKERALLRDWIATNLDVAVKRSFKRQPIRDQLRRLES